VAGRIESVFCTQRLARPLAILVGLFAGCGGDDAGGDGSSTAADDAPGTTQLTGDEPTSVADTTADSTGADAPPSRWIATADFLAGTLTLVHYDKLVAGVRDYDELVVTTIDLSAYPPGPLEAEIAPDGHTALVSVSPGFYDGIVGQNLGIGELPSSGTLLAIDLDTAEVITEIATADVAMGIAFAPDGAVAYTANFGLPGASGSTLSVIDMSDFSVIEDVEVGDGPEQVAISPDGSLGIVNVDSQGGVRVFSTDDIAGTLTETLMTASDPSGVAFAGSGDLAVVANSISPSNWAVIDLADPSMPVVREQGMAPGGFPYGATAIPGTTDVLVTIANDSALFQRVNAASDPAELVWTQTADMVRTFTLGIAVDVDSGLALSGAIGADKLLVVPLDGSGIEAIDWSDPGPCYVAIGPVRA
jgi:DNA-binding beta-propeller fold protein YncE